MSAWVVALGLGSWKPVLAALLMPPLPAIALAILGFAVGRGRRRLGLGLFAIACAALWLETTAATAEALQSALLRIPPPLSDQRIAELARRAASGGPVVILILGGGRDPRQPEYGTAGLRERADARLRYGVWLARRTRGELMFSGGVSFAEEGGISEAEVADRVARRDHGVGIARLETRSRDTRENASLSLQSLSDLRAATLVIVTHGWHMERALREFERAATRLDHPPALVAAPMGLAPFPGTGIMRWLPSPWGFDRVSEVMHEAIGLLAGGEAAPSTAPPSGRARGNGG